MQDSHDVIMMYLKSKIVRNAISVPM